MLNKANIFCTVIKRSFLFILISFSLVYTQDPPPEFEFSISIYQSFYFFLEANIDGENLVAGEDWIASFSVYDETMGGQCSYIDEDLDDDSSTLDCYDVDEDGILSEEIEICVGSFVWSGEYTTVPVMGTDGTRWTVGYMHEGALPKFKIYDASAGEIYNAVPSIVYPWSTDLAFYVISVDVFPDCIGDLGGDAFVDTCGECVGGNTGLEENYADIGCGCFEEFIGPFYEDSDGDGLGFGEEQYFCENPGLGWSTNQNDPEPDCSYNYFDCNNDCGGNAAIDDCGVCSGGLTGSIFNDAIDCDGECFGSAFTDDCGECVGGNTGTGPCDYVSELPEQFEYFQSTMQAFYYVVDASIGPNNEFLSTNDWIGLFNGDVCVGAVRWDGTFTTIPAMGDDGSSWTDGYLQTADFPTFKIYDVSEEMYYNAFPGEIIEIQGTDEFEYTGFGNNKFFYVYDLNAETPDCNGVFGGTAYIDACGVCSGGSTGLVPDSDQDCAGVCSGEAFIDDCGICAEGTSGNIPNENNLGCGCYLAPPSLYYSDFDGDGFGSGTAQSYCEDPGGDWVDNNLDPDPFCFNSDLNTSLIDDCGVCEGDNIDQDCAGICFGNSEFDDCGVCNGDNSACSSPSVSNQNITVNEDEESIITLDGFDPNNNELTFSVLVHPSHGSLSISGDLNNQIIYSSDQDYYGSDQFSYIAFNGEFYSNVGYVSIDVAPVNDSPTASSIYTVIEEDSYVDLILEATDIDGDDLTFSVISGPENGTLVINGNLTTYTPNTDFNGQDIIEFVVSDGELDSDVAVISITVSPVNDAPVAYNQAVELSEDTEAAFSFDVYDSDSDNEEISILFVDDSVANEFGLITLNGIEATFSPLLNVFGEFSIQYQALDGDKFSEIATLTLNILPVNDAPVLSTLLDQSTDEEEAFSINLSVSDVDSDNLSIYFTNELINSTGTITDNLLTIVPDNNYNGSIEIDVSVTDGELIDSKSFILFVLPINDPPVLENIENQISNEDETFVLTVYGYDVDSDNIVYWVNSLDNISATMDGNVLTLLPELDWYGSEDITVNISDGEFTSSTSFTHSVLSVNDPPVISSVGNQFMDEDQILEVELSAVDSDGDDIIFDYSDIENATVSLTDNMLYVEPNTDYNGSLVVSFSATDGEYIINSDFSVEVYPINDPPLLQEIQNQQISENEVFEYQLVASDVDEDVLEFFIFTSGYSDASIEGSTLTVEPNSEWSGTIMISVLVSDGEYYSEVEFDIEVLEINDPPSSYDITSNTFEDNSLDIDLLGSDPDTEQSQLTYVITSESQYGEVQISGSVATYIPNQDYNGQDEFFYSAYDLDNYSEPSNVTIDILPFNDPPFAEEVTFSVDSDPYEFDLSPFIGDIDGDELEIDFITQGSTEDGIATLFDGIIVENGGANFTYYKPDGMVFFDIILYKVKDGLSESGIYTINFNLFGRETPRNLAPIAFDQDVDMLEDISQEITLVGFDVLNDFSEETTFEIIRSPEHGDLASEYTIVDSGNSHLIQWSIVYTPDNNYYGSDEIKYLVTNPDNLIPESNEGTITININSQNDAPITIIDIPDLQINEDFDDSIINLSSFFGDIDGDQLDYTSNSTDTSLLYLEVDEEFLSIIPQPNMNGGPITVSVTASDSELEKTQTFAVEILSINDAPTVNDIEIIVEEDGSVLIFPVGSDLENDPLTFMLFNPPQNGVVESDGNVFTYTPDPDYDGEDQFTYRANDGILSSEIATVSIFIESVNDAPVISEISTQSSYEDNDFMIILEATDPDEDEITFEVSEIDGFNILLEDDVMTLTPPDNFNGDVIVQIGVTDGELSDELSFTLNIIPVNDPPDLSSIINQSINEDNLLILNLSASDIDNDELLFSSSSSSSEVSSFITNNILTVVPNDNFNGNLTVLVEVSDGELFDSETFNLTINPIADPPQISEIDDQEIQEGELFNYSVTITDPDDDDAYLTDVSISSPDAEINFSGNEFTIDFPEDLNGEFEVLITVSDGELTAQELFILTILAVNDPPVSNNMSVSTDEDVSLVLILEASDVDDSELIFTISEPLFGSISLDGSIVTYTPDTNYNGQDLFEFWASDGEFDSNISTVTIDISSVNDMPIIVSDPVTDAIEDIEYLYQVEVFDPEDDDLVFNLIEFPDGMIIDNEVGLITWTPTEGILSAIVTVSVYDNISGDSYQSLQTYLINVEGVNDIPVIISDPPLTAIEDQEYTYQVEVYDPDSDIFYYSMLIPPPDGLTISDQGLVVWTPLEGVVSSGTIALAVWDISPDEAQLGIDHPDLQQFVITVTPINDGPIIISEPEINATEDVEYIYQVLVDDIDSDVFIYDLINAPDGMQIDQSGLLSWTPTEGVSSSGLINLQVSDGGADNAPPAVQSFAVSVTGVNDSPVITSIAPTEGRQGEEYVYQITVEDPDDDEFIYILLGAPDEMEIDFSTGLLTWTPSNGGIFGPITLKVLDGGEDFASPGIEIFSINVEYSLGPTTVAISLHEDFNLISYPAIPEDNSIENVLSSLGEDAISILTEGLASIQLADGWIGSLNSIVPERGYWLRTPEFIEADSILYTIENAIPTDMNFLYEIHPDYNLISYVGLDGISIGDALPDDVEGSIISIVGEGIAAVHLSDGWVGSLEALYRNKGYWLRNVSETDTLYFSWNIPEEELLMSSGTIPKKKITVPELLSFNQSSEQAFYFVKDISIEDYSIKSDDWIVAFNRDVIVGARQWAGDFTDVPVMGYNGTDITVGYCELGDVPEFKLYISSRDQFVPLTGHAPSWVNLSTPIISELSEMEVLPESFSLDNPYPNPFNPSTEISFSIPVYTNASVVVYDLLGQEIDIITDKYFSPGYHSIIWSPGNIASGMYFVRLMSEDISISKKVMFIK